eukprot:2683207-Pyramimonas_sp.AAC.1
MFLGWIRRAPRDALAAVGSAGRKARAIRLGGKRFEVCFLYLEVRVGEEEEELGELPLLKVVGHVAHRVCANTRAVVVLKPRPHHVISNVGMWVGGTARVNLFERVWVSAVKCGCRSSLGVGECVRVCVNALGFLVFMAVPPRP